MLEFTNKFFCRNIVVLGCLFLCVFACKEDEVPESDLVQFPRISMTDADVAALESDEVIAVTVKLSWAYTSEVQVDYLVKEQAEPSAVVSQDFEALSGTLTFAPGQTEQSISIPLVNDLVSEPDEKFELELSNAVYGKLIATKAILTIQNDDEGFVIDDAGEVSPDTYPGYTLVWEDQFDGGGLDAECWTHEIGGNGWGNNELQYYTDSPLNSFTASGYLVIEARKQQVGNNDYTSARLITAGKKEFKYGRIDIRAKLPKGKGLWPALWMLGSNFYTSGWPSCGEIDIMELVGHQPSIIHGTAHYGASPGEHQFKGGLSFLAGEDFNNKFHIFTIIWKENSIQWLRDGIQYFSLTPADLGTTEWPFNNPFFFIFNVAVGGNWPGSPDETTVFPQRMIVDYVRVFQ